MFWRQFGAPFLAVKTFAGYLQLNNISKNAKFNLQFVRITTKKTSSSKLKSAQHNQVDVPFYSEIGIDSKCEAISGSNNQNKKIIIKFKIYIVICSRGSPFVVNKITKVFSTIAFLMLYNIPVSKQFPFPIF